MWKVGKGGIEGTGERLALDRRKHRGVPGMPAEAWRKKWADAGGVGGLVLDVEGFLFSLRGTGSSQLLIELCGSEL